MHCRPKANRELQCRRKRRKRRRNGSGGCCAQVCLFASCCGALADLASAKGLVGKLPGNPASCPEEPCNSDPQHVLQALKWMSLVFGLILLLPLVMYYVSKLISKMHAWCSRCCCGRRKVSQKDKNNVEAAVVAAAAVDTSDNNSTESTQKHCDDLLAKQSQNIARFASLSGESGESGRLAGVNAARRSTEHELVHAHRAQKHHHNQPMHQPRNKSSSISIHAPQQNKFNANDERTQELHQMPSAVQRPMTRLSGNHGGSNHHKQRYSMAPEHFKQQQQQLQYSDRSLGFAANETQLKTQNPISLVSQLYEQQQQQELINEAAYALAVAQQHQQQQQQQQHFNSNRPDSNQLAPPVNQQHRHSIDGSVLNQMTHGIQHGREQVNKRSDELQYQQQQQQQQHRHHQQQQQQQQTYVETGDNIMEGEEAAQWQRSRQQQQRRHTRCQVQYRQQADMSEQM